jgi:hypothetical protein
MIQTEILPARRRPGGSRCLGSRGPIPIRLRFVFPVGPEDSGTAGPLAKETHDRVEPARLAEEHAL